MDDLIDFRVSDDFLDFYHRKGMTPFGSGRLPYQEPTQHTPTPPRPASDEAIDRLWQAIRELRADIRQRPQPPPKDNGPKGVDMPL